LCGESVHIQHDAASNIHQSDSTSAHDPTVSPTHSIITSDMLLLHFM